MKATALFFLLASMVSTPSRWDSHPSKILITNANLWKVNSVQMGKTAQAVNYFENASVSTNQIDTTMKFLILDQNKVNTAEKAFIRFDFDKEKETFSINSAKLFKSLENSRSGSQKGICFSCPVLAPKKCLRKTIRRPTSGTFCRLACSSPQPRKTTQRPRQQTPQKYSSSL